jgi:HlyD family secretion protein
MKNNTTGTSQNPRKGVFSVPILFWLFVVVVIAAVIYWFGSGDESVLDTQSPQYTVKRGDLIISVLEGGNLKALRSKEVKSEVEGSATIIYLIPEGTRVTEEDIEKGTLLVELDSSDIRERLKTQEITYQSALSDYVLATEAYEIQLKQNESDIRASELAMTFAKMDLERYLGEDLAEKFIDPEVPFDLDDPALIGEGGEDSGLIKGASRQAKRDLETAISLAEEELVRAKNTLEWTTKLYEKKYVSRNDLEGDTIALNRRKVELEKSKTALELFKDYEFSKEAQKLLSDYLESIQELERTKARARAQEAQKKSTMDAREAQYELQKDRLAEYTEQVEKCVIRATTPGLVVWSNDSDHRGREQNLIEEGSTVRQRQSIITIPDISTMAVEVKVHETSVDRVAVAQKAVITVDALPEIEFRGEVLKIGVLPDTQSRWLNPDLKVYSTDVSIDGDHDFLKPGMSAQVEIIIKELRDVLLIPIQAVVARAGMRYCQRLNGNGETEIIPVVTGEYNDTFVEIKEGLAEGDIVLIKPHGNEWEALSPNGNGRHLPDMQRGPGTGGRPEGMSQGPGAFTSQDNFREGGGRNPDMTPGEGDQGRRMQGMDPSRMGGAREGGPGRRGPGNENMRERWLKERGAGQGNPGQERSGREGPRRPGAGGKPPGDSQGADRGGDRQSPEDGKKAP